MILVEVQVPVLQQTYDFSLDENRPVHDIILEIRQIIARKLRENEPDAWFEIHSPDQRRSLSEEKTLAECGIKDGATLIFV